MEKLIIYQLFPRIFSNPTENCVPWGPLQRNGSGKFEDFTPSLLAGIKDLGVNCLWMTGIIEHATKTDFSKYGIIPDNPNVVKGEAGSPYAIKDYYDVDPALATRVDKRIEEFESLVKRIHMAGMKFIIDFVPNHTARVYHSDMAPAGIEDFGSDDDISMNFARDNNYYYISNQQFYPDFDLAAEGDKPFVEFPAKATGNDCFTAFCNKNDWYETVKLNYGHDYNDHSDHFHPVPDTWLKMLHILRYWCAKGIDGFRCDMVFMVPLEFWHWAIPQVKANFPNIIFIGEIYDVAQYRPFLDYGCFDYLYDKVNLYDTLVGIETKGWSAAQLTGCWQTVDGIGDRMLNFLENHDEVRFASDEYAKDSLRVVPSLVVSSMISKGPFMIYYGQELGERGEENEGFAGQNHRTTIFDYWSLSSLRRWINKGDWGDVNLTPHERFLRNLYKKVLTLCNSRKAISDGEFFDLMYVNLRNPDFNPHRHFAFLRYSKEDILLIIVNFSNEQEAIKVIIPSLAFNMAHLPTGTLTTHDLLWDKPYKLTLVPDQAISVNIGAADAIILPLTTSQSLGKSNKKGNFAASKAKITKTQKSKVEKKPK
ncbi:MAG: alpha-amylase family protein [Muribaculaceae bacterium]|nr:alpha-amylase family protein [Muribaculaceae bacterium]